MHSRAQSQNMDVAGFLTRLGLIARRALDDGMGVQGYVSTTNARLYTGKVEAKAMRDVSHALKNAMRLA
jgi:hypothetical protein